MGTISDEKVHQWLACIADTPWASLHYESPGLGGVNKGEVSGGGYHRCLLKFSVPANRTIWSMEDAQWSGLLRNRLTHFGLWDDPYKGTLQAYGRISDEDVIVLDGHGFSIRTGQIAISIA